MKIYYLHLRAILVSPTMLQVKLISWTLSTSLYLSIFTYLSKDSFSISKRNAAQTYQEYLCSKNTHIWLNFYILLHMYQKQNQLICKWEMKLLPLNCLTDDLPTKLMAYNFIIDLGIKRPPPPKRTATIEKTSLKSYLTEIRKNLSEKETYSIKTVIKHIDH